MQVLIIPKNAVLDGSVMKKTILILVNKQQNNSLQSVSKDFSDEIEYRVEQRNGPEITWFAWILDFGNESNVGGVNAFQ